jgi:hypothetical protein
MYFKVKNHMKFKPVLLACLLCASAILFSFRTLSPRDRLMEISSYTGLKADTGGQVVSLDLVQACINKYDSLMKAHGFSNTAGQPIDLHLTTTAMITNSELFDGLKLQNWIKSTVKEYNSAGKKLMIKIQLGVYDMNYLNVYQPDPALRALYNNRIAVFLVPVDGATGKSFQSSAMMAAAAGTGGSGGSGGTGYDFGGLQP